MSYSTVLITNTKTPSRVDPPDGSLSDHHPIGRKFLLSHLNSLYDASLEEETINLQAGSQQSSRLLHLPGQPAVKLRPQGDETIIGKMAKTRKR